MASEKILKEIKGKIRLEDLVMCMEDGQKWDWTDTGLDSFIMDDLLDRAFKGRTYEEKYYKCKCFIKKCGGYFVVNVDKQIFYCFLCHSNGDVISLICIIHNTCPLTAANACHKKIHSDGSDCNYVDEE